MVMVEKTFFKIQKRVVVRNNLGSKSLDINISRRSTNKKCGKFHTNTLFRGFDLEGLKRKFLFFFNLEI